MSEKMSVGDIMGNIGKIEDILGLKHEDGETHVDDSLSVKELLLNNTVICKSIDCGRNRGKVCNFAFGPIRSFIQEHEILKNTSPLFSLRDETTPDAEVRLHDYQYLKDYDCLFLHFNVENEYATDRPKSYDYLILYFGNYIAFVGRDSEKRVRIIYHFKTLTIEDLLTFDNQ